MGKPLSLLFGAAIALALVLKAGAAEAPSPRVVGDVIALDGHVTVRRALGSEPLKVGDKLYRGDTVETTEDGVARIALNAGITVTARALARVRLDEHPDRRSPISLLTSKLRTSLRRALLRPSERVGPSARRAVASIRG